MRGLPLVAAMTLLASPALAADDVMAGYYGNTAIATGGMTDTHTTFSADHTFDMRVPAFHMEFKGSWKLDGAQICRTFDSPPPGVTNPLCTQAAAHKVGDTWTATANGKTRTIKLVQGIQ
ncbi:MAG TPA: hypothetical protein VHU87_15315 [Rhizomicrobium sp.]|jgi:hypothetical protein|nr:hypothetical protein [Rhizomicrobium sp.]